ncbi:hypothetical protein, partial [Actinomyces bowdenii]|uniref:hypothetical protein n=1 Tax=Actinomyces bowdenii TaxID=131109 RepID=UPI001C895710
ARALADVARAWAQAEQRDKAVGVADLAERVAGSVDEPWQRAAALADVARARALNDLGESDRTAKIIRSELRSADKFANRSAVAAYCGKLALICLDFIDAPGSDSPACGWRNLASQCLVRSWMLGASAWDRFDALMTISPDLAMKLVRERLLPQVLPQSPDETDR